MELIYTVPSQNQLVEMNDCVVLTCIYWRWMWRLLLRQSLVCFRTVGSKEHQRKLPQTYWSLLQTKIRVAAAQILWRTSLWTIGGKDRMTAYSKTTPMFTNNIISCCKTGSVLWHVRSNNGSRVWYAALRTLVGRYDKCGRSKPRSHISWHRTPWRWSSRIGRAGEEIRQNVVHTIRRDCCVNLA